MTARKTQAATRTKTTSTATAAAVKTGAPAARKRRSTTPRKRRTAAVHTATTTAPAVGHEAIAREAFLLWEASGRPHGQELSHWLEAERRLSKPEKKHRAA